MVLENMTAQYGIGLSPSGSCIGVVSVTTQPSYNTLQGEHDILLVTESGPPPHTDRKYEGNVAFRQTNHTCFLLLCKYTGTIFWHATIARKPIRCVSEGSVLGPLHHAFDHLILLDLDVEKHVVSPCFKALHKEALKSTLKTLTSLIKESRPFFLSDNRIWSFPSLSSLSDSRISRFWRLFYPCDHSIWSISVLCAQILLSLREKGT